MDSIPIENINLEDNVENNIEYVQEDDELTPEDRAFNEELNKMKLELKRIDKERKNYVKNIREKIRNYVKNGDDAISYLPEYLELTIDFVDYEFMDDDQTHLWLSTDYANGDGCYQISNLADKLCGPYLNIEVDCDDTGYLIYYSNKDDK